MYATTFTDFWLSAGFRVAAKESGSTSSQDASAENTPQQAEESPERSTLPGGIVISSLYHPASLALDILRVHDYDDDDDDDDGVEKRVSTTMKMMTTTMATMLAI